MTDITPRDRREVEKWVVRMLDEPERHRAALARWLLAKPGRRELYDQLFASVEDASQAMPMPALDQAKPAPIDRVSRRPLVAAAAAFLLLLLGASTYLAVSRSDAGPAQDSTQPLVLSTRPGEVRLERLDDGSHLTLDGDTRITVHLASGERRFDLARGRVRFVLASDPRRPLLVRAGDQSVSGTGGVFDVANNGRLAIVMFKGRLELTPHSAFGRSSQPLWLRSGQKLAFASGQPSHPSVMPASPADWQWTNDVKSFDDVPISDLIAEANGYSPVKISLADPTLGQRRIFGDIHIRDANSVAQAIATFLGATIDRSNPDQLVIRK